MIEDNSPYALKWKERYGEQLWKLTPEEEALDRVISKLEAENKKLRAFKQDAIFAATFVGISAFCFVVAYFQKNGFAI